MTKDHIRYYEDLKKRGYSDGFITKLMNEQLERERKMGAHESIAGLGMSQFPYSQSKAAAQANAYNPNFQFPENTSIYYPNGIPTIKNKETSMLKEVSNDLKCFIREHKSMIYWILVLLIIDHFFFKGAFKEKLNNNMHKLVGKVEDKINEGVDNVGSKT